MPIQVFFADAGTLGVAATTQAVTCTNVPAGSVIHVFTTNDSQAGPFTVTITDPTNGTYTLLDSPNDATNLQQCFQHTKSNVAASASLVITATFSASVKARGICAVVIPGASGVDGHTAGLQAAPGTGANALTIGPPSPNNGRAPALVVSLCMNVVGSTAPTAGTNFTSGGSGWAFGATNLATVETRVVTGLAPASTYTATTGTDSFILLTANYDLSSLGLDPRSQKAPNRSRGPSVGFILPPLSAVIAAVGALAGVGTASFDGSATPAGAGSLAGTGTASFDGAATFATPPPQATLDPRLWIAPNRVGAAVGFQPPPLAGAPLVTIGALAGAGSASFDGTGNLTGAGALSGVGSATFNGAGTLAGSGALAGAGTAVFNGAATLTLSGSGSAVFNGAGNLTGSGALAGTGSALFDGSGTLAGAGALSGAGSALFNGAATFAPPQPGAVLDPRLWIAPNRVGAAVTFRRAPLAGAPLVTIGPLAGVGSASFDGTGNLTGAGALAGSGSATFNGAGTLAGAGSLSGAGAAVFNGAGTLTGSGALVGAGSAVFNGAGNLTGSGALVGAGSAVFNATGSFQNLVSGSGSCAFAGAGALGGAGALAGSGSCAFAAAGAITATGALSGAGSCLFAGTGTPSATGLSGAGACAFSGHGVLPLRGAGSCAFAGAAAIARVPFALQVQITAAPLLQVSTQAAGLLSIDVEVSDPEVP